MRTISLRLDDATDAALLAYCQQRGLTQTDAVKSAILHLVATQRPSPAALAEHMGLIGAFRSTEGDLGENHAQHLKSRLRQRLARDSGTPDMSPRPQSAPRQLLIDTGPLVAWLDAGDKHHGAVSQFLASFDGELLSTWPVMTEVCHLLPEHVLSGFLRWVAAGGLSLRELPATALPVLADRMDKYADLPMDLADASLIWLAETTGILHVLTLDRRDFGIYRTERGKALRNVLDER